MRSVGLLGLVGGVGFSLIELAAHRLRAHPLDPLPSAGDAIATALCLCTVSWAGGWLWRRRAPRSGAALGLSTVALVWAPEALRAAGVGRPDLPGVLLAAAVCAAAWRVPRLGVAMTLLGALASPAASALRGPVAGLSGSLDAAEAWRRPRGPGAGPDILLVTVDTVRADTGLVEALPGPWQVYDTAISAAPWTLPAVLSLMTGQPVREHGGGLALPAAAGRGFSGVVSDAPWLPEQLRSRGYATAAVVCNPHLRASQGLARGFSLFLHHDDARDPQILRHALDELRRRRSGASGTLGVTRDGRIEAAALDLIAAPADVPRLLWVHLLDPHEYRRQAVRPPEGWAAGTDEDGVLRAAYQGNVAATAARVGRLADAAAGWVVVVTSDHGEALGEQGRWGHGHALDDTELRVPLAIRWPDAGAAGGGPHLEHQVATFDLAALLGGGEEGRLPARDAIDVGGVRRDPDRFARRRADGRYVAASPGERGAPSPYSEDLHEALESLGYVEPEPATGRGPLGAESASETR